MQLAVPAFQRRLSAGLIRGQDQQRPLCPAVPARRRLCEQLELMRSGIVPDRSADLILVKGQLAGEQVVVANDAVVRKLGIAVGGEVAQSGLPGIELRQGDAAALPLADASVDAAFAHVVLQYLPSPAEAVAEMARIVRPDGVVVVTDFLPHEHEWMRQELGVHWLGFEPEQVESWFAEAGLADCLLEQQPNRSAGRDLPATFIASGRRGH